MCAGVSKALDFARIEVSLVYTRSTLSNEKDNNYYRGMSVSKRIQMCFQ